MKSFVLLFTFFATVWQAANAQDWSARLRAEHQWLLDSFATEVQATPEATEIIEDEISNAQAAPVREMLPTPAIEQPAQYQPSKKRSR